MAKKSTSSPALVFEFRPSTLQTILDGKPDKVVFTVSVEAVQTTSGKVGALRIKAKGVKSAKVKSAMAKKSAQPSTATYAMIANDGSGSPHPPGLE